MTTHTDNIKLIDKTSAYWYACGYNDFRKDSPYIDPMEFANWWLVWIQKPTHPSLQDAFRAFAGQVLATPAVCACGNDTWLDINGADECAQCGAPHPVTA